MQPSIKFLSHAGVKCNVIKNGIFTVEKSRLTKIVFVNATRQAT